MCQLVMLIIQVICSCLFFDFFVSTKKSFDCLCVFSSASPEWVTMSVSGDNQQPFAAGTKVTVTCSSGGGKPVPDFRWSLAGEEVEEHAEEFGADLEAVSEISFVVEEDHDGQEILCW